MGKTTEYSRNQNLIALSHFRTRVNNFHRQVYQGKNAMRTLDHVRAGKRMEIGDVESSIYAFRFSEGIVLSATEEITSSTI